METATFEIGWRVFNDMVADIINNGRQSRYISERVRMDTSLPSIRHIQFYQEEE